MVRTCLAVVASAATMFAVAFAFERTIPATNANQDYFATTQALFAYGTTKQSSCGADKPQIEACIKACNSPGLQERSGCCCVAFPSREFFVGIRGGCRYRQQLLNFTTSLVYSSRPAVGNQQYFNTRTCSPTNKNPNDAVCECSLSWELSTEALEMASPLPSPSASLTPGLTPSVSPSATPSPVTPEPSEPVFFPETPTPDIPETPVESPPAPSEVPPPVPSAAPTKTPDPTEVGPSPLISVSPPMITDMVTPIPSEPTIIGVGESPSPELIESPEGSSPTPTATNADSGGDDDDDDGTVCVEESHLVELGVPRAHMVHVTGKRQKVLCPPGSLPCGTARHMLRRQGVSMSYEQFCSQFVKCEERTAIVNSVYSHLWEETEHDDGVMLTMYDTAYPESAQVALHSVMSAGRRAVRRLKRTLYEA